MRLALPESIEGQDSLALAALLHATLGVGIDSDVFGLRGTLGMADVATIPGYVLLMAPSPDRVHLIAELAPHHNTQVVIVGVLVFLGLGPIPLLVMLG